MSVFCGGEYSCIHSVFNQWIKLSIYSSIDVSYDNCLSMLSRQRDTRGLSIIRQLKSALRGRGGGRHMNLKYWIHAACSIIPLPQCKLKKRRSQSLYTEHMFCHRARAWLGYSLAMAVSQYGSTPFDLLPLTNNNHQQQYNCNDHNGTHSPIHSTPHQRRRRRKYRRTWVSLSLSCDLSLSRIKHTSASSRSVVLR